MESESMEVAFKVFRKEVWLSCTADRQSCTGGGFFSVELDVTDMYRDYSFTVALRHHVKFLMHVFAPLV